MSRTARPLLALLLAVGLLPAVVSRAELDDAAWRDVNKQAKRLMQAPGEMIGKRKTLARIAEDDSERSAKLLVKWGTTSVKFRDRELVKALGEAQEDYDKLVRILLKKYDTMPPNIKNDKDAYDAKKRDLDRAKAHYAAEVETQRLIGKALEGLSSPDAVEVLLNEGEKKIARTKGTGAATLLMGVLACYVRQPVEVVGEHLLELARTSPLPEGRIRILNWIANTKVEGGYDAAVACLGAPEEVVKRSAIFTLQVVDDPRCVKPLIDALESAEGLLQVELERALHFFTGQSFDGDHGVWSLWWEKEGEAWFKADDGVRYRTDPDAGKADEGKTSSFYGVETKSKRIVFVLDRSGSMLTGINSSGQAQPTQEGGESSEKSKIELAREQLKWSIETLPKGVHFNVIFYATDVQVWKEPPEMVPATKEHKQAAIDWFMAIDANGYTRTFDALAKALDYASGKGGADTVFLLSDGSPTAVDAGEPLTGDALEAEYAAFLEKNRIYKCVVHTIGVGRAQNRPLMQRIAKDTGGTYRDADRK
jgi:hypothetical protein